MVDVARKTIDELCVLEKERSANTDAVADSYARLLGTVFQDADVLQSHIPVSYTHLDVYKRQGEISADMLLNLGVQYVIIGHSERREYYAETDETVNLKVLKALEKGLTPIVCVGEKLEERENGVTAEVVRKQTKLALKGVAEGDVAKVVVAYEPIWAIGTGKTATSDDANDTIKEIRAAIKEVFGNAADEVRIQYGGSMNPKNATELMAMSDIDGGLIGGASLKAEDFSKVVNY